MPCAAYSEKGEKGENRKQAEQEVCIWEEVDLAAIMRKGAIKERKGRNVKERWKAKERKGTQRKANESKD